MWYHFFRKNPEVHNVPLQSLISDYDSRMNKLDDTGVDCCCCWY